MLDIFSKEIRIRQKKLPSLQLFFQPHWPDAKYLGAELSTAHFQKDAGSLFSKSPANTQLLRPLSPHMQ